MGQFTKRKILKGMEKTTEKAYKTRQRLQDPVEYDRIKRKKKGRKRKIRTKTNIRKSQTK